MPPDNVTKLVSEADTAADLKRRFAEALKPVLVLADEAASKEINVSLVFSRTPYGMLQLEAKLTKEL